MQRRRVGLPTAGGMRRLPVEWPGGREMRLLHPDEGRRSAFGPLQSLNVRFAGEDWRGKGTSGQAASLHWGGLRFAQTSLRCSASWPRRRTHFAHCVRCVRTSATSQWTIRASREATSPGLAGRAGPVGPAVRKAQAVPRTACPRAHLLGTPEALRVLPERAFAETLVLPAPEHRVAAARRAVPGGGDFCGDEERQACGRRAQRAS